MNIIHPVALSFLLALSINLSPQKSWSFDYLEHLYLTDRVCSHTTKLLEHNLMNPQAPLNPELLSRYLALSLFCPQNIHHQPYCREGEKLSFAYVTQLSGPPSESSEYGLTLGDLASLPDHIGAFGVTPRLSRGERRGLTSMVIEWIASSGGGVTGTVYDVAEDACEGEDLVDWNGVNHDIDTALGKVSSEKDIPQLPTPFLAARSRAPLQQGPSDPAALYSFDNPHYLDLIFRNHHHFGEKAYSSWLGFHNVGIDLARAKCPSLIDPDPDWLDDLAEDWPAYEGFDWFSISSEQRQQSGCSFLSQIIDRRLKRWAQSHDPKIITRLGDLYPALKVTLASPYQENILLHHLVSALFSLVYEGSGLHFLQDSLAGGHIRTIRSRGGLQEARYDHDRDNRDGVVAIYQTAEARHRFIAYGDSYLLGPGPLENQGPQQINAEYSPCKLNQKIQDTEIAAGRCALEVQRGLLSLATMGSLLDWAYGGLMYQDQLNTNPQPAQINQIRQTLRKILPTVPPISSGIEYVLSDHLNRTNIPIPSPDFSYQVLSHRFGFDAAGSAPRLGIQLALLDTLGYFAHWLSSYRFGLHADLGDGDLNRWSLDAGYTFHFRWAARFTLDLGLSAHMGWRDFDQDIDWYTGLTPITGITLLPEGWLKIPLEFTINYQLPLTFYDEGVGYPGVNMIDGHYLSIGLGLAFMK